MTSFTITLTILALGALAGSIPIKGFYLESLGLLLVGMLFGSRGYTLSPVLMDLGIAFFIYGVALQIGPGFVKSFKSDGVGFSLIALGVALTGTVTTLFFGSLFGLSKGFIAGTYAGTFNNALALIPGLHRHGSQVAQSFGLVYPVAFTTVMLFTTLLPRIMGIKITDEIEAFKEEQLRKYPPVRTASYTVANPALQGKSFDELNLNSLVGVTPVRVLRDDHLFPATPETRLQLGDLVEVAGLSENLEQSKTLLGAHHEEEIPTHTKRRFMADRRVLITSKRVVGKPLNRLCLKERFGATITRIRRGGFSIPITSRSVLQYGDKVTVVCKKSTLEELTDYLGNDIHSFGKQEFYPIFLGMTIGALLGSIPLGGGLTMGIPGGILIVGILAGRLGRVGPVVFTVSPQSNHDLKRMGLVLFMAALGTASGYGLRDGLDRDGLYAVLTAVFTLTISLSVAAFAVRKLLGRNFIDVAAVTTGSVACTPALELSNARTGQESSAITYAAIYPMGLLAPLLGVHLLLWLLQLL